MESLADCINYYLDQDKNDNKQQSCHILAFFFSFFANRNPRTLRMAKNYFDRYVWLIDVINRHGHIPFNEISYLWAHSPLNKLGENYLPERTFHNHRQAILDTFGIEIKCDRSLGYYIANSDDLEGDEVRQWRLESLSMSNLLNETKEMRDRILFERIPSSQKWLSVIVNAMRDGKAVEITYQGYGRNHPSTFTTYPYCLKLFKQRWYMLASSEGSDKPWIYALDERMHNAVQTDESYKVPKKFNADRFFADCFGIIVGADWEPQEVKIRVTQDQAAYFDSLPLHHSQQKLEDESDEQYVVYRYYLAPSYDFKQELLSHGPSVEVLAPEQFRQEVMNDIAKMAFRYRMPVDRFTV